MKKLLLIDAYAMIFRAYYALFRNPRINSKGMNTSAVFGFVNTLEDVLKKEKPDYVGVAFDPKGGTFRHEIYPEYKAQREETPEDIRVAVPYIKEILAAYNIPGYEIPGFEADDVIGTLALMAKEEDDILTLMMTGDKDYGQLVRDNVMMLRPRFAGGGFDTLGPKEICEKYGIDSPLQVIDLLALMGDSADNVPGCPGVGEKTAVKLIQQFGSIDNLLTHTDELKGAMKQKVTDNKEGIIFSRMLVTIKTDVPVSLDLNALARKAPDKDRLKQIFDELEFKGMAERILGSGQQPAQTIRHAEPDLFSQPDLFMSTGTPAPAPPLHSAADFADPEKTIVGYNLKKEVVEQLKKGTPIRAHLFDTMLASYVLRSDRYDGDFTKTNLEEKKTELERKLKDENLYSLFADIEMPLLPVLARMEMNGVRIDTQSLQETSKVFSARMAELEREISEIAGIKFNISSPKQVGEVLFEKLRIVEKAKKTKTGQYVTSEEVLQNLKGKHPIVSMILDYRGYKKLLSTYIDVLPKLINPETGHIHTSFNQAVTATGRLSSSNPNLQNIPIRDDNGKEVRKAFIPDDGCLFFSADYSQIELRLMAHLSGDEHLIEAFREGHDIHAATAAKIFRKSISEVTADERRKAKTANFGIIYGITTFGLAERMMVSRTEAKELIDGYFTSYPKVKEFMEREIEMAREKGYAETLFGRRCYLPDIYSHNAVVRGYAERNAINAPIQGTAADIIKVAMVNIDKRMREEGLKSTMILQVHDELNFNVVPDEKEIMEKLVIEEMESAIKLDVPLIADSGWGNNWLEAH